MYLFLIVQKARKVFSADDPMCRKAQAISKCHAERTDSDKSLFFFGPSLAGFAQMASHLYFSGILTERQRLLRKMILP